MMLRSLLFMLLLTVPALAAPLPLEGFTLDCPWELPDIARHGGGGRYCTWPQGVPYEKATAELIVVTLPKEAVGSMKEAGVSPAKVALSNHLGLASEPVEINKTLFMGATGARLVYESTVPRPHKAHVFSKSLPDGSFVMVAVRDFGHPQLGKLLQAVANTFRQSE